MWELLLLVVPPSSFKEMEIQKLIHQTMKRKPKCATNKPSEHIASKRLVWMPYYRIQFEYRRSDKELIRKVGEKAQSETAINAMFCGCTKSESELILFFRHNYFKYNRATLSPRFDEIVGSTFNIDFDAVLSGLLKRLNEAKNELYELRSTLNKRYTRFRRYSRVVPMMGGLKETERFSEKIAKLSGLTNILSMCLNSYEDAGSIKTLQNSTFYYPTVVVALEGEERNSERFLVVNLVKSGSILKRLNCDKGLTQLCNNNVACCEALARSVAQASSCT
jgi:hypothetical protein